MIFRSPSSGVPTSLLLCGVLHTGWERGIITGRVTFHLLQTIVHTPTPICQPVHHGPANPNCSWPTLPGMFCPAYSTWPALHNFLYLAPHLGLAHCIPLVQALLWSIIHGPIFQIVHLALSCSPQPNITGLALLLVCFAWLKQLIHPFLHIQFSLCPFHPSPSIQCIQ